MALPELTKYTAEKDSYRILWFPPEIETFGNWVKFGIHARTQPFRDGSVLSTALKSIFLPLPATLSDGYHLNYSNEGVGPIGRATAQIADTIKHEFSDINSIDLFTAKMRGITETHVKKIFGEGVTIAARIAAELGNAILQGGPALGIGYALNPHKAALFESVNFREHHFSYDLIARSQKESDLIYEIIQNFKYHAAPDLAFTGQAFTYPEEFDISFHRPEYLYQCAPAILKSIDVNYHATGKALYFQDTFAPVSVRLDLKFTEITIATKQTIPKPKTISVLGRSSLADPMSDNEYGDGPEGSNS